MHFGLQKFYEMLHRWFQIVHFMEKKGSGHSVYWEFPNDFNNELKRWFNEIRA